MEAAVIFALVMRRFCLVDVNMGTHWLRMVCPVN